MSSPDLVNAATLGELGETIGNDRLERLIERFRQTLSQALHGEARTAADLGREAHTLVSMSGMLGCDAFSSACRALEYAAQGDGDLDVSLTEARRLRDETLVGLAARG